jgi:hypothetical protein
VIECGPTARLDAVKVAPPPLSGLLPSGVAPSKKVTIPVGVPTEEETVAVYVTAFCASAGFAEDSSPIAGVTLLTCRLRFVDQGVKRRMARGGGRVPKSTNRSHWPDIRYRSHEKNAAGRRCFDGLQSRRSGSTGVELFREFRQVNQSIDAVE